MTPPPLALYVHFPWCVQKCPYCDFNSYTLKEALPETQYIDALLRDFDSQLHEVRGRPIVSIFMGGGTPSLFSPTAIARVLDHVRRAAGFASSTVETTLEANPGTIERGRFAEYRDAGITRVSLGAQSFDARQLARLGRIHSADETRRAAEELHAAGLSNFNLDLMYALPDQGADDAESDLRQALALRPAHVSQYHLTIEPGTLFAAAPPTQPDDEVVDAMLARSLAVLGEYGFEQYEVSGYARPGMRCTHNLNYWTFGDYLGVGAGAHGKITRADGAVVRTQHLREPRRYLAAGAAGRVTAAVPAAELPFEFAMNALRLVDGFEADLFESRTGLSPGLLEVVFESARDRLLIERRGTRWRPTAHGRRFLNEILVGLLPDGDDRPKSGSSSP